MNKNIINHIKIKYQIKSNQNQHQIKILKIKNKINHRPGCFLKFMTDFPTLSYASANDIPTLSYTWSLKRFPFRKGPSLIAHCREKPTRIRIRVTVIESEGFSLLLILKQQKSLSFTIKNDFSSENLRLWESRQKCAWGKRMKLGHNSLPNTFWLV